MNAHRRYGAVILLVIALMLVAAVGQLARDAVASLGQVGEMQTTDMEDGQ